MSELRPGWSRPKPDAIPRPTVWPSALALGTMFFAWGLIASPIILVVGLVLFGVSLGGWISEIRHER
jgi:hypothetical protein